MYLVKKNRTTKSGDKPNYSKNEVNVMISHACEEAVTRALKVHASVTNRNKRRKVSFHTKDSDQELDEKDIQEQVEQLK